MTPFTQPHFARGNQLITMLAEAKEQGYFCCKLEILGGSKYRAHFTKDFSCVSFTPPIQVTTDENHNLQMRTLRREMDSSQAKS